MKYDPEFELSRFISGFYKATNGEDAAVHYFSKTELMK